MKTPKRKQTPWPDFQKSEQEILPWEAPITGEVSSLKLYYPKGPWVAEQARVSFRNWQVRCNDGNGYTLFVGATSSSAYGALDTEWLAKRIATALNREDLKEKL